MAIAAALIVVAWCVAGRGYALLFDTPRGLFPNSLMSTGQALGPRAAAAEAPASLSRGVRAEPQAQARPHRHRKKGMSASGEMPRLMGMRSAAMRLAEMPPPTAATHATNHPPTTPRGSPGRNSWPGWARSFLLRALGCGGDIRLRGDRRQEPASFEPEVRKREKARRASPARSQPLAHRSEPLPAEIHGQVKKLRRQVQQAPRRLLEAEDDDMRAVLHSALWDLRAELAGRFRNPSATARCTTVVQSNVGATRFERATSTSRT